MEPQLKRRFFMNNNFKGDLIAKPGMVYDYISVGGSIYASGADTRAAFPS